MNVLGLTTGLLTSNLRVTSPLPFIVAINRSSTVELIRRLAARASSYQKTPNPSLGWTKRKRQTRTLEVNQRRQLTGGASFGFHYFAACQVK